MVESMSKRGSRFELWVEFEDDRPAYQMANPKDFKSYAEAANRKKGRLSAAPEGGKIVIREIKAVPTDGSGVEHRDGGRFPR